MYKRPWFIKSLFSDVYNEFNSTIITTKSSSSFAPFYLNGLFLRSLKMTFVEFIKLSALVVDDLVNSRGTMKKKERGNNSLSDSNLPLHHPTHSPSLLDYEYNDEGNIGNYCVFSEFHLDQINVGTRFVHLAPPNVAS
jgi:hypothetical protein